ncbi:hypothetical protein [Coleofasciculus sp. FACHB-SPT9]|uniref:hypothetical protein n=1 Tax=Cyanophyceae TaxID=3028117 RepID=UPI0016896B9D|nr:hypothetical protein [Coleofasciculus sp. FACHB-SPT9]MBD1891357.1 hypothetical protein [Coleofasciculus sp. FACHB-SPT9]
MSYELDIIQLQSESLDFYSDYVPVISFKNQYQKDAVEGYIIEKVKDFFEKLKIDLDITKNQISYQKLITEEDFKKVPISYFHENLFYDLGEREADGRLKAKIKWGITFDEKCVPSQLGYVNPSFRGYGKPPDIKKERRYGTIDINGTPVFYYIYFTLQEILDVIKKL